MVSFAQASQCSKHGFNTMNSTSMNAAVTMDSAQ